MTPRFLSRLWLKRYLSRNACSASEIFEFPLFRPDEQRRILARKLLDQIRYFGARGDALPEWREARSINDPDTLWKLWPSLPIVGKKLLVERFPATEIGTRYSIEGSVNSTGGSTGEPTHFYHDATMTRTCQAATYYAREKLGWRPGMPLITIWGSERDIGKQTGTWKQRLDSRLRNEYLIDGYNLTDRTVDQTLQLIRQFAPVALAGFTSMLEYVADRVLQRGESVQHGIVAAGWNGGEMLFEHQKQLFRDAFGCPLLNLYGGRELSTIACQSTENGPLEILRPWVFVEVVDDNGRPVAPGDPGRLICTSTVCRGTPFLRYEIGDLGAYAHECCNESGLTALSELLGRVAGLFELPDGRKISNLYWNHLFKEIPEVKQFQVMLRSNGTVNLLLRGSGFAPAREKHLRETLSNFLGPVPVQIDWVQSIPRTTQGKLIQVIREPQSVN
jgi:phenylacetate-CoA ligase